MLHKEILGLVLLGFIVWIAFSINPGERLERACKPFAWTGSVVTSATTLMAPSYQQSMKRWWDKFDYGCQYSLWRLFYQDDYNKALAEQAARDEAAGRAVDAPEKAKPATSSTSKSSEEK